MELSKAEDIQCIVIGGEFRHKIYSCVGYLSQLCLDHLNFDKGFITGNHFSLDHGFTTPTLQEAEFKRRVLSVSKQRFVLMDYSKYGDDSLALIAPLQEVDTVITDWHIPIEIFKQFNDRGVKVLVGQQSE
jgi:DeoR family fructose operon transcriptional repressor